VSFSQSGVGSIFRAAFLLRSLAVPLAFGDAVVAVVGLGFLSEVEIG